jgi:hypothetical protein
LIVVSDTSPILNLAAVNRLHLLSDLYREIVIPPAVARELERNGIPVGPSWIRVVRADDQMEVGFTTAWVSPFPCTGASKANEGRGTLPNWNQRRRLPRGYRRGPYARGIS